MLALYIIGALIVLILLLLSIPVDFLFYSSIGEGKVAELRAVWLYGLVKKRLRLKNTGQYFQGARKMFRWHWHPRHIIGNLRIMTGLLSLLSRVRRSMRVQKINGFLKLGLGNPLTTGTAFMYLQPIMTILSLPEPSDFRIEPVFIGFAFEFKLDGKIRVLPLLLVWNLGAFAFSKQGRRLIREFRRLRREQRQN
ncbi:MAG: hypothetical protein Q8O43_00820 [Dehalococcoidia bacterium]|nr:hypothetical protein [Dehalococcoidia bacterium]